MLVRVLGPLRVEADDGCTIPLTRPTERRILTALAALRPRAVSTDVLIDAVWAEHPPPSARKTIQTNVFRMRRRLGAEVIVSERSGYRLAGDVVVDADHFETATRRADSLATWSDVVSMLDGTPFEELTSWHPVEARRAALEEIHRAACEARAEAALTEGRIDWAISELEQLVIIEPLRERRWCLLVQGLVAAGREAEALRAAERARRTLAEELGACPGAELSALYESILAADGRSAERAPSDATFLADRHRAAAAAAAERGEVSDAVREYLTAARLAREGADHRRFALAALGAAGSGWQTGLDATADAVSLLSEAVAFVPPGPTALRAQLLTRLAVAQSHHGSAQDCEAHARSALAIARALDDPELVAAAMHALAVVIDDPARRREQRAAVAHLVRHGSEEPEGPWRRLASPILARIAASDGDMVTAKEVLSALADEATAADDPVGLHAASFGAVLDGSLRGDWPAARSAAGAVRAAGLRALVDPTAAQLAYIGMIRTIDLYDERHVPGSPDDLEWPRASLAWAALAWRLDGMARAGDHQGVQRTLVDRDLDELVVVERDGYWLATLAMLASAAHQSSCRPLADILDTLLDPYLDLAIVDPGLIYRGSVAHASGLAAATCGRRGAAIARLSEAARMHEIHGSTWMTARSSRALASLSG